MNACNSYRRNRRGEIDENDRTNSERVGTRKLGSTIVIWHNTPLESPLCFSMPSNWSTLLLRAHTFVTTARSQVSTGCWKSLKLEGMSESFWVCGQLGKILYALNQQRSISFAENPLTGKEEVYSCMPDTFSPLPSLTLPRSLEYLIPRVQDARVESSDQRCRRNE